MSYPGLAESRRRPGCRSRCGREPRFTAACSARAKRGRTPRRCSSRRSRARHAPASSLRLGRDPRATRASPPLAALGPRSARAGVGVNRKRLLAAPMPVFDRPERCPVEGTSRNRPPLSESLNGFASGFLFLICASVSTLHAVGVILPPPQPLPTGTPESLSFTRIAWQAVGPAPPHKSLALKDSSDNFGAASLVLGGRG